MSKKYLPYLLMLVQFKCVLVLFSVGLSTSTAIFFFITTEPGECDDGKVRLMNGTIEQEGRAEVCVNGIWSSICGYSWSQTDGYTICKELGYDGPSEKLINVSCIRYFSVCLTSH